MVYSLGITIISHVIHVLELKRVCEYFGSTRSKLASNSTTDCNRVFGLRPNRHPETCWKYPKTNIIDLNKSSITYNLAWRRPCFDSFHFHQNLRGTITFNFGLPNFSYCFIVSEFLPLSSGVLRVNLSTFTHFDRFCLYNLKYMTCNLKFLN